MHIRLTVIILCFFSILAAWPDYLPYPPSSARSVMAPAPGLRSSVDESILMEDAANAMLERDWTTAVDLFGRLYYQSMDPDTDPLISFQLAYCLYKKGDNALAEKRFAEFIGSYPNHPWEASAWYYLGVMAAEKGLWIKAESNFDRSLALAEEPQPLAGKLECLLQKPDLQAAAPVYARLEAMPSGDLVEKARLEYLGACLENNHPELTEGYRLPAPESPYYRTAKAYLGGAAVKQGNTEGGIELLQDMAMIDDYSAFWLAKAIQAQGDSTGAGEIWRRLYLNRLTPQTAAAACLELARVTRDNQQVIKLYKRFLKENSENPWMPVIACYLGQAQMEAGDYAQARVSLARAAISSERNVRRNAAFMAAETAFRDDKWDESEGLFSSFVQDYPEGELGQEARFKLVVLAWFRGRGDEAANGFKEFIAGQPDAPRTFLCHYFLGESYLAKQDYEHALLNYRLALRKNDKADFVRARIAQTYLKQHKYGDALTLAGQLPDKGDTGFVKQMVSGNVFFALKRWSKARECYQKAVAIAQNKPRQYEYASLQLARTYYQLKDYQQATRIFRNLSDKQGPASESYLLMSAASAFSAEEYERAAEFYSQFIARYPRSRSIVTARLGLADSYFNQGQYAPARKIYQDLLKNNRDENTLKNALEGLQWAASRDSTADYAGILDESINNSGDDIFIKPYLYERQARYYIEQKQCAKARDILTGIQKKYPKYSNLAEVELLLAEAAACSGDKKLLDKTFAHRAETDNSAGLYYRWYKALSAAGDTLAAIGKLKQAVEITPDAAMLLELLRLLPDGDAGYDNYAARLADVAEGDVREQGRLLEAGHLLALHRDNEAETLLSTLQDSEYEDVAARAWYLSGSLQYRRGQVREAVTTLLKVRWLYPQCKQIRLDAELLLMDIYLKNNDKAQANTLLQQMQSALTPARYEELRQRCE